MQTKTLGGDRLGAGKKMKVELHGYERSTHDLSYIWRSTMSAGTLVPFMSIVALPGDTFDIDLDCDVKTHPTIGPLFGSHKVQLDIFQAPIRLYNSKLHNNALNVGRNMAQIKLPLLQLKKGTDATTTDDFSNSQINPSCILAYLGIRGIGTGPTDATRTFNAVPYLAYWEIYKNYYANKQEEKGHVIHTTGAANTETVSNFLIGTDIDLGGVLPEEGVGQTLLELTNGTVITIEWTTTQVIPSQIYIYIQGKGWTQITTLATQWNNVDTGPSTGYIYAYYNFLNNGVLYAEMWRYRTTSDMANAGVQVSEFLLTQIDDMREQILAYQDPTAFILDDTSTLPYAYPLQRQGGINNCLNSQEGLALKTYQSDLFNNWIKTDWIDGTGGITEVTAIDTSGGSFTIDTLNLSKKVYDMLNRIAVSGGSYDDWLDAVYDHDRIVRAESPIYHGGLSKELVFQEVVSNSASITDGAQPLGTLAGKGIMSSKHKGGKVIVKVDEPSYLIGIISLTPRVDYSQGNSWDMNLETLDDLHKPALDQIGFQELITEQLAWWTTHQSGGIWTQKSAGKQPAWVNYMTNINKTFGNFAIESQEMFMTLNRRYEWDGAEDILDLTTYIDPAKFNFIFAETAPDAQNFWVQIAVDIIARRKMSAKIMPNL